jgi:hypothetical protein
MLNLEFILGIPLQCHYNFLKSPKGKIRKKAYWIVFLDTYDIGIFNLKELGKLGNT